MSDTDELIRKVREGQKKDETDALINQARAAQQSPSTDVVIAQARTTVPKEVPAGGLFGLMRALGIKEKVSPPTPPQPGQPLATGEAYAVGQDPRKGFWGNVGEALIDPSEIAQMAATGGLTGLITKGPKAVIPMAKSFTYEWAPDIVKGVAGFGNKFLEGLGAKAAETGRKLTSEVAADIIAASRPAERVVAELIAEGSQPSVATITKTIALEKQGTVEYLETVYPNLRAEERGTKILREIAEKDVAAVAKLPAEKIAAMTPQERLAYQTALAEAKLIGPRTPVTLEQAAQLRKMGLAKKEIEKLTTEDAAAMIVREQAAKAPSVTKLTESEKLATPILGPGGERMGAPIGSRGAAGGAGGMKPPPEVPSNAPMSDSDWAWINSTPRPSGLLTAKSTLGKLGEASLKAYKSLMMVANPPQWVVKHEPTGKLSTIYQLMDESVRKSNASLHTAIQDFRTNVTVLRDTEEAKTLAIWLNTFTNPPKVAGKPQVFGPKAIPVTEWTNASPELKQSFVWMRNAWDKMGDELVTRGLMAPEKKLKNYFFHMFRKDELKEMWQHDLNTITKQLERAIAKGKDKTQAFKDNVANKNKIEAALTALEERGTILYNYIPSGIQVPFLKERKGVEGYLLDPHRAFERYLHLYHDKVYKDAVIKESHQLMTGLDPLWKLYTHRLIKNRYMGIPDPFDQLLSPIKAVEHGLTSLQFASSMGGNIPSALRNATQNINTIADAGFFNTARGAYRAFSSKGRAEWTASGHAIEIPGLEFESLSALRTIQDKLAYFFSKVESMNRRIAFSAGMEKAEQAGLSGLAASRMADDVLKRTQFYYGKLGAPLGTDIPGMSIVTQFGTYTLNQLNLFHSWILKEPKKFVSYLLFSAATAGGAKALGIDLSNTLGLGPNFGKLYDAWIDLLEGEDEKARVNWNLAMPAPFGEGQGSGVLPSSIAPVYESLKKFWDKQYAANLPVVSRRFYEAWQAIKPEEILQGLKEGKGLEAFKAGIVKQEAMPKVQGGEVPAKEGVQIRQIPLGTKETTVKTILTPYELFLRTFVGRPVAETRAQEAAALEHVVDTMMQEKEEDFIKNIIPVAVRNNNTEIMSKWLAAQKPGTANFILKEIGFLYRKGFFKETKDAEWNQAFSGWLNSQEMQYKLGVFEAPDRTRSLP